MGMGFQTGLIAFVTDLLAVNRKLMEEVRYAVNANTLASNNGNKK
jgi:hypothetical protein